ncbi:MAG: ATP-binding protein [Bacteroidales bacterium]|nr:ATP-binding protein [Bacteroidales bacterium]
MKFLLDKSKLSEDRVIFFDNFEYELRNRIQNKVNEFRNLSIIMVCELRNNDGKFIHINHNASFDIEGSFVIHGVVESFVSSKIKFESDEISLHINLEFKNKQKTHLEKLPEPTQQNKADDGLPTFFTIEPRYDFDRIIMPEEIKKNIYDALNVIKHKNLIYKEWGFEEVDSRPRSILNFYGPPGTGKTMCAHAISKSLSKPLLALNYSEIESKYVGDAPKNLKKAFDTAKEQDAVMFFDEADSFLGKRIENVSHGSDQALNSLRSQMLILLEDFEGVVLFATNLVTNFDKAFNSRILASIKLDLPNKEARAEIIKVSLPSRLPIDKPFSDEEILEISDIIEGFSGREIKNAILTMLLKKAGECEDKEAVFTIDDLKQVMISKKEEIEKLKAEENLRLKTKIANKLQEKVMEEDELAARKKKNFKKRR